MPDIVGYRHYRLQGAFARGSPIVPAKEEVIVVTRKKVGTFCRFFPCHSVSQPVG